MPSVLLYILAGFGLLWNAIFTYFMVKVILKKTKE